MTNNFEVRYSLEFFQELEAITFYIKSELKNNIASNKLIKKVDNAIQKRQKNAASYEQYKTNGEYAYYKIYVDNYTVFYTITENSMEIRSIKYKKRDLKNKIIS